MTLSDGLRLRDGAAADLEAIAGLRASVGWDAHEWALRYLLTADNARCFVVEGPDGDVVAAGSGVAWGPLGVVGNMVVAEPHRGHGIGHAVLEAVLDDLRARGVRRFELYATSAGRPLYARAGFMAIAPGSRVEIPRDLDPGAEASLTVDESTDADELAAFDAPRWGADRRGLLRVLVAERASPVLGARRGSSLAGYGWLRPDRARVGPIVADGPDIVAALLIAAFERLPDATAITFNLPMSNAQGLAWLRGLGVEPDPWDGRMALGPELPRRDSAIYGNVLGSLG